MTGTMPVWVPDVEDQDRAEHGGLDLYVGADPQWSKHPARWYWVVMHVEHFVSGPYPGTPDFNERTIGEGDARTYNEARWRAFRCAERALIADEVNAAEELAWAEQMEAEQRADDEAYREER